MPQTENLLREATTMGAVSRLPYDPRVRVAVGAVSHRPCYMYYCYNTVLVTRVVAYARQTR